MATVKVTMTFDEATVARINDAAERLSIPKSAVVREAIQEFHTRIGRLSESERTRMLRAFDKLLPRIPSRPASEVDQEILSIRRARKAGGRMRVEKKPH
jgi:hypothetical protein